MTIFGIFFGGWWTNFLLDIFNSANIPMGNKCLVIIHILTIFASFYVAAYLESWKKLLGIFALFDTTIAISLLYLFSPNPIVAGELFVLKGLMSMISLGLLQFLTIHYSKLSLTRKSNFDDQESQTENSDVIGENRKIKKRGGQR